MTTKTEIKNRPDGSIDTAHYIRKAHLLRSKKAHGMFRRRAAQKPNAHNWGLGWIATRVVG